MAEPRFQKLFEELRAAGIARRNARRAVAEMEDHFLQSVAEARARGAGEVESRREAHASLGSDPVLVSRYASRPELLAWSSRWPALWFTVVPLGCYLALSIAVMGILVLGLNQMSSYLHTIEVAPRVSRLIDLGVRVVFVGLFPAATAAAFGIWAERRRLPLRWPLVGIAAVSILASLINLEFVVTGGPSAGYAGAGIGFSMSSILVPIARALGVGALASVPIWLGIWERRRSRECPMI
jgi:hypothetical protein